MELKDTQAEQEKTQLSPKVLERLETRFGEKTFSFTELIDFSNYDLEVGFYSGKEAGIELVGVEDRPLAYPEIKDHSAFMALIRRLQQEHPGAYKTPVEIHAPYYSIGVARYMETLFELGDIQPIVYEIGAGNATLAKDILDYWKEYNPELYKKVKYRIVDASQKLVGKQRKRLGDHEGKVEWVTGDARRLPFADNSQEGILVNTELLDNLPTTCIKRVKRSEGSKVSLDDFVEVGYRVEDGRLVEKEILLSEETKGYIEGREGLLNLKPTGASPTLNIDVGEMGYIGIEVQDFYQELARVFKRGYVMSFDYQRLPTAGYKGGYMEMSVHRGDDELRLKENIGNADIYFSVDCWTASSIARRVGFENIRFDIGQGSFFKDVFSGKNAEHEYEQLQLGKDKYTHPLLADFPNTFAIIHSIGLGSYPTSFFQTLDAVVEKHHLQKEDLTLGRSTLS